MDKNRERKVGGFVEGKRGSMDFAYRWLEVEERGNLICVNCDVMCFLGVWLLFA